MSLIAINCCGGVHPIYKDDNKKEKSEDISIQLETESKVFNEINGLSAIMPIRHLKEEEEGQ